MLELLRVIIYAGIGIIIAVVSYKLYDMTTPFDLSKELSEEKNLAVGIVVAGIFLGIAIIVAAAIAS